MIVSHYALASADPGSGINPQVATDPLTTHIIHSFNYCWKYGEIGHHEFFSCCLYSLSSVAPSRAMKAKTNESEKDVVLTFVNCSCLNKKAFLGTD